MRQDKLLELRTLGGIHPMKLKNMLRRIHPHSANLFHGRSPLSEINNNDLNLAHSMPPGAVHINNAGHPIRWLRQKSQDKGGLQPNSAAFKNPQPVVRGISKRSML
jgi:hypothetical protein